MRVPLLDLKEHLAPLREEILQAITKVVDSTCYILGPEVEKFEKRVAEYCETSFAIGVASGTDALLASLMALGVKQGDLVLTTPFSFFATMGCIVRLGARPVFVDIDPVSYNIDPAKMAEVLELDANGDRKIKVILPVHLYGQCADMTHIMALADKYDLPVLEDAAQAIGATCPVQKDGKNTWHKAGAMGSAGCFSFFPSKNLGGIGDAGMIVCNDKALFENIKIIRVHGGAPKYHHKVIGGNFRIDPIQAAVLDVKLPHLPDWHKKRRANALLYDQLFGETDLLNSDAVKLPQAIYRDTALSEGVDADYHIYNQYVIRVKDRDGLKAFLEQEGITTEIYYPIPLHKQECLAELGYGEQTFPEAEKAAKETLALPIYPELTDDMQQYVVERIVAYFN